MPYTEDGRYVPSEWEWVPGQSIDRDLDEAIEKQDMPTMYRHLQRAIRRYVESDDYGGDPINWVNTEYGIYPEGGIESLANPIHPGSETHEGLVKLMGIMNIPGAPNFPDMISVPYEEGAFTGDWVNQFAVQPPTSTQGPTGSPRTGGTITPAPAPAPGFYAQPGASREALDFTSGGNPFAERAAQLGFSDFLRTPQARPQVAPQDPITGVPAGPAGSRYYDSGTGQIQQPVTPGQTAISDALRSEDPAVLSRPAGYRPSGYNPLSKSSATANATAAALRG
jgi:hypothetical protein